MTLFVISLQGKQSCLKFNRRFGQNSLHEALWHSPPHTNTLFMQNVEKTPLAFPILGGNLPGKMIHPISICRHQWLTDGVLILDGKDSRGKLISDQSRSTNSAASIISARTCFALNTRWFAFSAFLRLRFEMNMEIVLLFPFYFLFFVLSAGP